MKINETRLKYFWDNVVQEKEGRVKGQTVCWLWIGTYVYIPLLYGRLSTVGSAMCSAVIQSKGIPSKVSHRCTTKLCVNPTHLIYRSIKEKDTRYSSFTGKPLKPRLTDDIELISAIMEVRKKDRPEGSRISRRHATIDVLAKKFNISQDSVRKILLKAPLYDLLDEIKSLEDKGAEVQTVPHKVEGRLNVIDQALFTRNYNLPDNKNETSKI